MFARDEARAESAHVRSCRTSPSAPLTTAATLAQNTQQKQPFPSLVIHISSENNLSRFELKPLFVSCLQSGLGS